MATKLTARISVVLTPEMRDAYFDFCRRQTPRESMSERLVRHIQAELDAERTHAAKAARPRKPAK